jgi:hypothetical protein
MILTTHALTGAVIGKNLNNPWLIIILSIIAHFVMDSFRHGEYVEVFSKNTSIKNSGWKVILDLFVGITLVFAISVFQGFDKETLKNIVLGSASPMFPDFITFLFLEIPLENTGKILCFTLLGSQISLLSAGARMDA